MRSPAFGNSSKKWNTIRSIVSIPDEQLPRKLDRYLPFAIALEVKAAWGDHLTQTFFASTVMVED